MTAGRVLPALTVALTMAPGGCTLVTEGPGSGGSAIPPRNPFTINDAP